MQREVSFRGGRYCNYSPWNPYASMPPDRTQMFTLVELTNLWDLASNERGKLAEGFCEDI